jgi:glycosyltransferase involved in cell wall biosynthesis
VPIEGKLDDVFKSVVTCGIVERVEPKLRIILSGFDRNRLDRCYHFAQKTIVNPILHIVDGWDVRSVIGACDYMVQVRSDYADSLHVVDAWSRGVPVITNAFAEPAELLAADESIYDAGKPLSRRFACGLYKLMTDSKLREKIVENARKTAVENCSESVYRAQVVRLYQQLTQ